MKFRAVIIFFAAGLLVLPARATTHHHHPLPPTPAWGGLPDVSAHSAILFDADTGHVIFKKNENEHRQVASTQKLLSSLIFVETGSLSKMVTIEKIDNETDPTKLDLKPGDSYTRKQLLTALLVKSANNIARALARDNAGSLDAFSSKMNARMAQLGGTDSHFVNPNGLPADQYSTARDMARVARAVYYNQTLREIVNTRYYPFLYDNGKIENLQNTNHVLRTYSFCNGMKTGYTDAAEHCLITSGSWKGKNVIAVVYGDTKGRIWDESARLLAYGLGMTEADVNSTKLPEPKLDEE